MAGKLDRCGYEALIAGDLAWLDRQPRTLEREHIALIVRCSVDREYPELPDPGWRDRPPTVAELAAHHAAHPRSVGCRSIVSLWLWDPGGEFDLPRVVGARRFRGAWLLDALAADDEAYAGGRWRPLTAQGDAAPWPQDGGR